MTQFKQKTPVQIRFKDIDMMGHVNNANFITYFELARLTYFEALSEVGVKIDWVTEGVILAKIIVPTVKKFYRRGTYSEAKIDRKIYAFAQARAL